MWHQEHIDPMFAHLIESMIALRGVNPDKVYLMGYSAGGPWMAKFKRNPWPRKIVWFQDDVTHQRSRNASIPPPPRRR